MWNQVSTDCVHTNSVSTVNNCMFNSRFGGPTEWILRYDIPLCALSTNQWLPYLLPYISVHWMAILLHGVCLALILIKACCGRTS